MCLETAEVRVSESYATLIFGLNPFMNAFSRFFDVHFAVFMIKYSNFCPESIVSLGSARLEIKQIYIFKALKAVETVRLSSLKLTVFAEKPTMNISFHFDASIFLASFVRGLPNINSGPEKI